jgi:hypothetical protein
MPFINSVHYLLFDKKEVTLDQAIKWIYDNGYERVIGPLYIREYYAFAAGDWILNKIDNDPYPVSKIDVWFRRATKNMCGLE